jgi:peroxiredoxin
MSIQKGDPMPHALLCALDDRGAPWTLWASERLAGQRMVLFAVPGAFTRTYAEKHLPSCGQYADAITVRGIDEIVCESVNDPMVLAAWGREHGATGTIRMLSDGLCVFTRALGLEQDVSSGGYGLRSKRSALLLEDGKGAGLDVEPPGEYGVSSAEAVRRHLGA